MSEPFDEELRDDSRATALTTRDEYAPLPRSMSESEVRAELCRRLDAGMRQSAIAQRIGTSQATLSQFKNERYPGQSWVIAQKLEKWFQEAPVQRSVLKTRIGLPEWLDTPTSQQIEAALRFAQTEPSISLVISKRSVGKAATVERYIAEHRGVWVFKCAPSTAALAPMLLGLASAVDPYIGAGSKRPDELAKRIAGAIYGSRGLVIVGNAHMLHDTSIAELLALHEGTGIGLCLMGRDRFHGAGNQAVYAALVAQRLDREECNEVTSRVGMRVLIPAPTCADVDVFAAACGISGEAARRECYRIAIGPSGLRGLLATLRRAQAMADGQPIDAHLLRRASEERDRNLAHSNGAAALPPAP